MASLLAFFTVFLLGAALVLSKADKSVNVLSIPALFVFGDSLSDVGNNNYLNLTATFKANFPHYGIDIPGQVPTGRFSNGFNSIDFIAQNLGFKMSPPPYLSIKSTNQMLQGVNFASAGSGILETTNNGTLNMVTQAKYFENTVDALKKKLGTKLAKDSLAKSLYMVGTGSNDMFAYYEATGAANSTANTQFISDLVDKLIEHLMAIYNLGARKFAVSGTSYVGCVPFLRNLVLSGYCIEELNQMSIQFNMVARQRIQQLSNQLTGFKYAHSDWYNVVSAILESPSAFGFTDVISVCCEDQCNINATCCSRRNEYFFWDSFHPTEALYNVTSQFLLYANSTRFVEPINFKQLAES
ncbi:hypothetical protein LUZ60_014513 [Juncus effusus]|nr:hypothetical protein LUZ60_014513 [Juncus effusus]